MPRLGVNIDHVATLRQARGGKEPDPIWAAALAELAGADGITVHLREDRRHIQDRDVRLLRETVRTRLNLEASIAPEIVRFAIEIRPDQVTFVPERREELTTEGGLDAIGLRERLGEAIQRCRDAGISTSLFIEPDPALAACAADLKADAVELHTGRYALDGASEEEIARELNALIVAGKEATASGLALHAGHGLHYQNVGPVADIPGMIELNIGHAIVSRAVFVGLERAVREMKSCMDRGGLTRFV